MSVKRQKLISDIVVNGVLLILCIIWTLPTLGLLVSSFRPPDAVGTSGWWTAFNPARERKGAAFTLNNYRQVLLGKDVTFTNAEGEEVQASGDNLGNAFLNSIAVTLPSTVIPILIAAFAAYGFAWMQFSGRRPLFILVVALLVVPLQIALIPILRDYTKLDLNGTFWRSGWRTPASVCHWRPICSITTSAVFPATFWNRPSWTAHPTSPSSRA